MMSSSHRPPRRSRRRPLASQRARRPEPSAHPPVRVEVDHYATAVVLRVSGEFDLSAVDRVERSFDGAVDALTDYVVFDLRDVSFLDLSGLETLLRADARARRESFALGVVPPPGTGSLVFTATGAGRELRMLDDLP